MIQVTLITDVRKYMIKKSRSRYPAEEIALLKKRIIINGGILNE